MFKYIDQIEDFTSDTLISEKIFELDKTFMDSNTVEDGTTAIFVIARNGEKEGTLILKVGNIGDSRAALSQNKTAIALSEDHKPNSPNELARIEKAGGFVSLNRVRGNLALSRAIGDRAYKIPTNFHAREQQVTCEPEYKTIEVNSNDYLFLGCDGIYEGDIFTVESVIKYINDKLEQTNDLAQITADLLDECLKRGSKDNMSAMIIQFKDGKDYNNGDEYVPGPFHEGPKYQDYQDAYQHFAQLYGNISVEESRKLYEKKNPNTNTNSF